MKRISQSIMAFAMAAGVLFTVSAGVLQAADDTYPAAGEEASNLRHGSFDGYDKKAGRIWVSDSAFELTGNLRVIGTSRKAGVLSDIGRGEDVTILYGEVGDMGIPVAIELRRH